MASSHNTALVRYQTVDNVATERAHQTYVKNITLLARPRSLPAQKSGHKNPGDGDRNRPTRLQYLSFEASRSVKYVSVSDQDIRRDLRGTYRRYLFRSGSHPVVCTS